MTILWLTEFFPKEDKMIGGVQARCYFVSKKISQGNSLKIIEGVTEKYAKASFGSFFIRLFHMPFEIYQGLKAGCDLVEASNFVMYFPAWLIAKIKRKPIIFWYPDVYVGTWIKNVGPIGIVGEVVERFILHLPVDHYIAISNVVKQKLVSQGIFPKKISVIYCGIDESEISEIKVRNKIRDLIVVSRLIKYKKVDEAIKALTADISLAIIGWGSERENLESMSGKNVTFLGTIDSHKEVLKKIAESRILCHPSVVEGFGISIIEAMALGVPVLLADTETAREITKNWQGALPFSPENIKKLLSNKVLYSKKSKEALKLAKNYSWDKISQETLKLYENLYYH